MASEDDFKPGMFHLLGSLSQESIGAMLERTQGYLKEFGGYPEKSINNVAGVLQSILGKKEEALDLFNQILLDDPENINALENSRIVYDQLDRPEEAEVCAAKIKLLLEDSESQRTLALREARCLAEQGLAITFDIPVFESANDTGGDDFDRNRKAIIFFEKAFELDDKNKVFKSEERLQWQFFLAQSYHHIFEHYLRMGSTMDDRQKVFDQAVQCLVKVARESNQNKYRAKAWSLIGTFFWKEAGAKDGGQPTSVSDWDLTEEYQNPDKCFRETVKLYPEDPKCLNRYANFLLMKKNYQEALDVLNTSLELHASCNNWFAFSSRGQTYKSMYVQQQQALKNKQRVQPPDRDLLMRARQDFEQSLEIHPNLEDGTRLGEILDMLGHTDKALEEFQYVVNHFDGQKKTEDENKMGCLGIANGNIKFDTMASEDDFKPGMFHLLGSLSKEAIGAMLERTQGYLNEFGGYPVKSINNVAGVLQSMLGKKEEALDLFNQILLDDPENINALENSRIVYDQLDRPKEAEVCAAKIKLLLEVSGSQRTLALREARCLAEQGLAITFDIPVFESGNDTGGDDFDRNRKAIIFFEKAFELDDQNQVFKPEERLQWQFFLAQSYHHIFGHYVRMGSAPEKRQAIFDQAVQCLVRVARESNQNKYRAKAWSLIGTFFWKEPWAEDGCEPSSVSDCDLTEEYQNPDKCFREAVSLCPEDPKLLSRYARFLLMKKNYQEALDVLNTSLQLDASCNNWFALSSRGQTYKSMYVQQQQALKNKQRVQPPDRDLLMRARRDFEQSLEIHPNLQDRTRLGEILDMLGQTDNALEEFQYVVDHLDGQKNPEVHIKMGYCLRNVNGRSRRAIESFKRAVEIERANFPKLTNAYNVLQLLITMDGGRPGLEHLLDETCYWLATIVDKYEDGPISELFEGLCNQFREQMSRVSRRLTDQQRYSVASKIEQHFSRPSSPAQAVAGLRPTPNTRPPLSQHRNQMEKRFDCLVLHCAEGGDADWVYYSLLPRLEENHGYKCCVPARDMQSRDFVSCVADTGSIIVILSPNFCGDEHCMDQLRQIVEDHPGRVFPIMLKGCDVPDVLKDLKPIPHYSWEVLLRGIEEACGLR